MSPPRRDLLGYVGVLGEGPLARHRLHLGLALAVAVAAAVSLAACGRKGDLELPPGPATQPPISAAPTGPSSFLPSTSPAQNALTQQQEEAIAQKNGFDARGNPVSGPGTKRPFILDPLVQ
jgi:predicted small lipoprotein YifL